MNRAELVRRWEDRRDGYSRVGAVVKAARLVAEFLKDLEMLSREDTPEVLSLRDAADRSGYSVEHLARLVRQGRVPNAGRRYAPRIRAIDLPERREFAGNRTRPYDVNAGARTLRNGRQ